MVFRFAPLALLWGACATTPPPSVMLPELESGVRHFTGTVLTGPRPDPEAADRILMNDALMVTCKVSYLLDLPEDALQPLATRTRLVVSARGDEPPLPTSRVTIGARVDSGPAASRFASSIGPTGQEVLNLRGALPEGVSVSFYAESMQTFFFLGVGEVRRHVAILISREQGGTLTAALLIESIDPHSPTGTEREVTEHELILLEDVPGIGRDPLVLIFPSPFDPFETSGFIAEVTVEYPRLDPAHQAAVQQCVADLRREGEAARTGASELEPSESLTRTMGNSLRALDLAEHQRPAVVFLTSTHDAPLALDLALSADTITLAAWVQLFMDRTGEEIIAGDQQEEDLGWAMDSAAWELLAERLDDGELSTGLRATLARYAGEAGRFPGSIADALRLSTDQATFRDAVVAENRSFLASSDPAARVRAFDWLTSRNQAPAGYDPLGPREERREALDDDEEKRRGEGRQ